MVPLAQNQGVFFVEKNRFFWFFSGVSRPTSHWLSLFCRTSDWTNFAKVFFSIFCKRWPPQWDPILWCWMCWICWGVERKCWKICGLTWLFSASACNFTIFLKGLLSIHLRRSHGLRLLARTVGGIYGTVGSYKGIFGVVLRCILLECLVKINKTIAFDSIWRCLTVATVKMSFLAFSVSCCIFCCSSLVSWKIWQKPNFRGILTVLRDDVRLYLPLAVLGSQKREGWNPPESSEQWKKGPRKLPLGCYWGFLTTLVLIGVYYVILL